MLTLAGFSGHAPAASDPAVEAANTATSAAPPANAPGAATQPQETKPRGLFTRPNPSTSPIAQPGSFFAWLMNTQQKVHRQLAQAVKNLKTGNPVWAAMVLGFISFAYGVLHAAGPGHGKAVISSYVLANERTVKRGIALSFLAAAIQGLSALVIVGILVLALRSTSMEIKAAEGRVETISWGLVMLIGIWLLYGQIKAIVKGWQTSGIPTSSHEHAHAHAHALEHTHQDHRHHTHVAEHSCGCGHEHHHHDAASHCADHTADHGHGHSHEHGNHNAPAHNHAHSHAHDDCCGHAHMPSPDQLEGPWSWSKALAVAFSVGIRPCTGAIIVLVFAISQGLMWAGVFATFAMALGTAITVSALATLAVASRELATRLAGEESRWGWRIERAAGLAGAVLVIGLGAAFFLGSLQPTAPF
ncbi:MAG: nickel/cobalt transporter [Hyphomicrobiaceae bacterium]|nr:nickel/cobalt transporter [Hyphomicrobiaceae bacterium]